jgi:hypothetical protein
MPLRYIPAEKSKLVSPPQADCDRESALAQLSVKPPSAPSALSHPVELSQANFWTVAFQLLTPDNRFADYNGGFTDAAFATGFAILAVGLSFISVQEPHQSTSSEAAPKNQNTTMALDSR